MMSKSIWAAVFGFALTSLSASASPIALSLPPSAPGSGLPGSTVGWGYSITNGSSDYLLVSNSYFCEAGQDPMFTTCTQSRGAYNDYVATNFTVIAPSTTGTQSFNSGSQTGVGD